MYPGWLVPAMCYISEETASASLRGAPVGSFSFLKAYRAATDAQGQPRTKAWAMHHAAGNEYLAGLMLKEVDASMVLIVVRAEAGVRTMCVPTSHLRRLPNMQAFCQDFSAATSIPATADKLIHPGAAYSVTSD